MSTTTTDNIKIVLLGENQSGKTSFIIRYTTETIPNEYIQSTIQEKIEKQIIYQNKSITIEFHDTYNEEKLSHIKYPKDADFYLILFQVVNNTFDDLQQYIEMFPPEKVILVGTKIGKNNKKIFLNSRENNLNFFFN
jgi:GTPase SAR1 family protein